MLNVFITSRHVLHSGEFLILTSGAIKYFPISSQIKAYSTLVNPAPYLLPGSDSLGKNKFHNPAALALL